MIIDLCGGGLWEGLEVFRVLIFGGRGRGIGFGWFENVVVLLELFFFGVVVFINDVWVDMRDVIEDGSGDGGFVWVGRFGFWVIRLNVGCCLCLGLFWLLSICIWRMLCVKIGFIEYFWN